MHGNNHNSYCREMGNSIYVCSQSLSGIKKLPLKQSSIMQMTSVDSWMYKSLILCFTKLSKILSLLSTKHI